MLFVPPSMPFMVPEAEAATTHTIEMTETGFSQTTITITAGDSLRFLNTDLRANGSIYPHAISEPESIAVSELSYTILGGNYLSHTFSSDKINFGNPGTEKFYERLIDDNNEFCCQSVVVTILPLPDTTPPVITGLPPDQTFTTTDSAGYNWAYMSWQITATDNETVMGNFFTNEFVRTCVTTSQDGTTSTINLTFWFMAPGVTFPVGINTVTCSATDEAGNEGTASFTVTVALEVAGPIITSLEVYADPTITTRDQMRFHVTGICSSSPCQTDLVFGAINPSGILVFQKFVTNAVATSQSVDGTTTCCYDDSVSFDRYPFLNLDTALTSDLVAGTWTMRVCANYGGSGLSNPDCANQNFTIAESYDTTPPVIIFHAAAWDSAVETYPNIVELSSPASLNLSTTNSTGIAVVHEVFAYDSSFYGGFYQLIRILSHSPEAGGCTPTTGWFPVGTTVITCTATDVAGNEGTASFTVTVVLETDTTSQAPNISSGNPTVIEPSVIIGDGGVWNMGDVAISGTGVHLTWHDHNDLIRYAKSTDGGNTFGNIVTVAEISQGSPSRANIAVNGNNVHVVWSKGGCSSSYPLAENASIHYAKSTNGGNTFGSVLSLPALSPGYGCGEQPYPEIAVSGNTVHIVGKTGSDCHYAGPSGTIGSYCPGNGGLIYYKSTNGGNSFGSPQTLDDFVGFPLAGASIAVSGNNVHILSREGGGPTGEVYYTRSTNGGNSFSTTVLDSAGSGQVIAASGNNVYVGWGGGSGSGSSLSIMRSDDNGNTFSPKAEIASTSCGGFNISASGSNVFLAWNNCSSTSFARSTDNGANFEITYLLPEADVNGGGKWTPAASGSHVVVVGLINSMIKMLTSSDSGQTFGIASDDTTPPVITFHAAAWDSAVETYPNIVELSSPASLNLSTTNSTGIAVVHEVFAYDNVDGWLYNVRGAIGWHPISGGCTPTTGWFPVGTTVITCTATDAAGNEGTASFTVTVVNTAGSAFTITATAYVNGTSPTGRTLSMVGVDIGYWQYYDDLRTSISKDGTVRIGGPDELPAPTNLSCLVGNVANVCDSPTWTVPIPEDWEAGTYDIVWDIIQTSNPSSGSTTVTIPALPGTAEAAAAEAAAAEEEIVIPSWIKSNAGWWDAGLIDNRNYVTGLQWLITNGIMTIPPTEQGTGSDDVIPSWVKNNARWWADGSIDDRNYVTGLQWLITNGVMTIG